MVGNTFFPPTSTTTTRPCGNICKTAAVPSPPRPTRAEEAPVKYLIVEDFSGQAVPFIFPRRVDHSDMREQLPYSRVVSAGFVELGPNGFACTGGNPELQLKARPQEDAAIIAEALRQR